MVRDKESNKEEELSQCLDCLNDGRHPMTQDEDIKELVDLAAFVKQSYDQEELPRALIDEVVNNLANEFQTKKQKRRNQWLYSGLVGTAAAVVIVAFTQLSLPGPADHNVAQQMDENREIPKIVAVAEQPNPMIGESTHRIPSGQLESEDSTKAFETTPLEEKSTPSASKILAEIIHVAQSPEIEEKTTQVATLRQEKSWDMTMSKSVSMEKVSIDSLQAEKNIQPPRRISKIMVIPNQTAQSTIVDTASGDIKQVYNLGNHDEIVITQGLFDESQTKRRVLPLVKTINDKINSLTLIVGKYNIKIQGEKTGEELGKIVESLIEKEIE